MLFCKTSRNIWTKTFGFVVGIASYFTGVTREYKALEGAFLELGKATVRFVMFVHLSFRPSIRPSVSPFGSH